MSTGNFPVNASHSAPITLKIFALVSTPTLSGVIPFLKGTRTYLYRKLVRTGTAVAMRRNRIFLATFCVIVLY